MIETVIDSYPKFIAPAVV